MVENLIKNLERRKRNLDIIFQIIDNINESELETENNEDDLFSLLFDSSKTNK